MSSRKVDSKNRTFIVLFNIWKMFVFVVMGSGIELYVQLKKNSLVELFGFN